MGLTASLTCSLHGLSLSRQFVELPAGIVEQLGNVCDLISREGEILVDAPVAQDARLVQGLDDVVGERAPQALDLGVQLGFRISALVLHDRFCDRSVEHTSGPQRAGGFTGTGLEEERGHRLWHLGGQSTDTDDRVDQLAGDQLGLAIGLVQALTSVQEMTLTFVPKLGAILVVFWITMSFSGQSLVRFYQDQIIPLVMTR